MVRQANCIQIAIKLMQIAHQIDANRRNLSGHQIAIKLLQIAIRTDCNLMHIAIKLMQIDASINLQQIGSNLIGDQFATK